MVPGAATVQRGRPARNAGFMSQECVTWGLTGCGRLHYRSVIWRSYDSRQAAKRMRAGMYGDAWITER
jgi:hypothetical protein